MVSFAARLYAVGVRNRHFPIDGYAPFVPDIFDSGIFLIKRKTPAAIEKYNLSAHIFPLQFI
jgi:hypothetical protein